MVIARLRRTFRLSVVTVLALLPLVLVVPRMVTGMQDARLASDFALLALAADEAASGERLLGPYSRFGWQHPGPAYFYWLAPFRIAMHGSPASLAVAAFVLAWGTLVALVWALRRWGDTPPGPLALLLALGYAAYLGPGVTYNPWNPAVTLLPFGLLLVLASALASGRGTPLVSLAAVASFLVQTHLGFLPAVGAILLGAAVLRRRARRAGVPMVSRQALLAAIGAGVLFWALPVVQQVFGAPGNLTAIVTFFRTRSGGHGLFEAAAVVARELAWPCALGLFGPRDQYAPYPALSGPGLGVVALVALLQVSALAFWARGARERPFTTALARLALLGTAAAVPAVMRISGEIRPYLTTWISVLGTASAFVALAALERSVRPVASLAGDDRGELVLAGGLSLALAFSGRPLVHDSEFPAARSLSEPVAHTLRLQGSRRPRVAIQTRSPELFFVASAVLLQLHQEGLAFAVDRPWWSFFGARWHPNGSEDGELEFHAPDPKKPPPLACVPNGSTPVCAWVLRPLERR